MPLNRQQRAQIAQETLSILDTGSYQLPDGRVIALQEVLSAAVAGSVLYQPSTYDTVLERVAALPADFTTTIAVSSQTTLDAARQLAQRYTMVACLNFASAKNPGGGFLSGSQAQEESLARATGLYAALRGQSEFYDYHRRLPTCLYSDHAIFSPNVPVFRDDIGQLLADPWQVSFITAAAVNAGAVRRNEPQRAPLIVPTMERRIRMVLGIAALYGCRGLVLGAWGCGVFQNDPPSVAASFARVLAEPLFQGRFEHVEFAIYDMSPQQTTLAAFKRAFAC